MKFLLAISPTVLMAVYSQLVTKWRIAEIMSRQNAKPDIAERIFSYITDPFIFSAYVLSLLSSFGWMLVVEEYPVSTAFPAYIGVLFFSVTLGGFFLLHEAISWRQVAGMILILAGVSLTTRT